MPDHTVDPHLFADLSITPGLAGFMTLLDAERRHQLAKFGDQRHPDGTALAEDDDRAARARHICESMAARGLLTWRDVLHEEVQEAFAESDPGLLRAELVQVAAVCAAWVSDLDRRPPVERCNVEFVGGGHCSKPAGHRPPGSRDPHTP
ncbi:hypothetical protein ACFWBI_08915 [Streptomyces sp. NPDC059982]|uniref:hypothetical protein n=1 Tax=unclassified Streptomyces TaxID=2593676 RepID=UPI00367C0FE0